MTAAAAPADTGTAMYGSRLMAVSLAVVLLATLDTAAYTYAGAPWALTALAASVLAMAAWTTTSLRRPPSAPAAFSLYVGTVAALIVLEGEEWHAGMPSRLMALYPRSFPPGVGITEHAFIAVFPLALSACLVLGALAYYHATAFGRFCAWLTFSWGLSASLSVYAYALAAGAPLHYLGGMISAPLPFALSVAGMLRLVRDEGIVRDGRERVGAP